MLDSKQIRESKQNPPLTLNNSKSYFLTPSPYLPEQKQLEFLNASYKNRMIVAWPLGGQDTDLGLLNNNGDMLEQLLSQCVVKLTIQPIQI
jgi:hypothetical protein